MYCIQNWFPGGVVIWIQAPRRQIRLPSFAILMCSSRGVLSRGLIFREWITLRWCSSVLIRRNSVLSMLNFTPDSLHHSLTSANLQNLNSAYMWLEIVTKPLGLSALFSRCQVIGNPIRQLWSFGQAFKLDKFSLRCSTLVFYSNTLRCSTLV